jgi:cyclopropane fatty-acyl-phospholipid synthase-like methyltransferase
MSRRFDLDLFRSLNDEYRSKPLVPSPRKFTPEALEAEAAKRAQRLDRLLGGLRDARVLEVGCGRGQLCGVLAEQFDCQVTGIDMVEYDTWESVDRDRTKFVKADMAGDVSALGTFDFIYSFSVWEHIEHPHAALVNARRLLAPDGKMFLQAQLYRGPKASHRYREVFFPWPHLLFDDEVFEAYYTSIGREPRRASWVNKLTYAQYLMYFDLIGFEKQRVRVSDPVFDEAFYERFEDVLGAYPKWDLGRDVIHTTLAMPKPKPSTPVRVPPSFARRVARGVRRRLRATARGGTRAGAGSARRSAGAS